MTFIAACRDFFGIKEGQKLTEFGKEIAALTPADREEIAQGLRERGYAIDPPMAQQAAA